MSSAYDNVRTNIICDILENKGCPSKIRRFVDGWMRNRLTHFLVGEDQVVIRLVNKGLPQGEVLSPTLYSIYHVISHRISRRPLLPYNMPMT